MKIKATLNGHPCTLEVEPEDWFAATAPPEDLNLSQAAAFCHVSSRTFAKWGVPKNANGRYSVKLLRERMENTAP